MRGCSATKCASLVRQSVRVWCVKMCGNCAAECNGMYDWCDEMAMKLRRRKTAQNDEMERVADFY